MDHVRVVARESTPHVGRTFVHTLPPELLTDIFHLKLQDRAYPCTLSRVCRRWKDILENASSFWTDVVVDLGIPRTVNSLAHELKLSKDRPLNVAISLHLLHYQVIPERVDLKRVIASVMATLVPTSARWQSFKLYGTDEDHIALVMRLLETVAVPELRTLEMLDGVEWCDRSKEERRGFAIPIQPDGAWPHVFEWTPNPAKLTSVRMDQRMFSRGVPPLFHLQALYLGIPAATSSEQTLLFLASICNASPRIQVLHLNLLGVVASPGHMNGPDVLLLPALLYLHLDDADLAVVLQLLNNIAPPRLRSCHLSHIEVVGDLDDVFDELASWAETGYNPFRNVQSLTLRHCGYHSNTIGQVLDILGGLRYLTLYCCDEADAWIEDFLECEGNGYFHNLEVLTFIPCELASRAKPWWDVFHEAALSLKANSSLKRIRFDRWSGGHGFEEFVARLRDIVEVSSVQTMWSEEPDHDGCQLARRYETEKDFDDWEWFRDTPW